jgi:hypothetical protein
MLEQTAAEYGYEAFFPLMRHRELSTTLAARDIRAAEFVLADVSLERPSCYFELGMAEALGALVVIIASVGTPIHQIGNAGEVRFYSSLDEYRSEIARLLEAHRGALAAS